MGSTHQEQGVQAPSQPSEQRELRCPASLASAWASAAWASAWERPGESSSSSACRSRAWSGQAEQTSAEARHAADAQCQQGREIFRIRRRENCSEVPMHPGTPRPQKPLLSRDIDFTPLTLHCAPLRTHRCACICTLCRIRRVRAKSQLLRQSESPKLSWLRIAWGVQCPQTAI